MKQISVMIKPASSLCNMRCKYCFYADESAQRSTASFGIMQPETLDSVLENIFSCLGKGDALTLAFQGGEPTLAGLGFFRRVVERVYAYQRKGVRVQYALQTNGLLLDGAWCAFLKENRFLVGLSIDGTAEMHDGNRIDQAGKGTIRRVLRAKKALEEADVDYNVLMVLTNGLARHPEQIWRFLLEQNISHVQLIPCLGPLDGTESAFALTPKRYASFYTKLFDLWSDSLRRGRYVSIKLFDDLVNLLAFNQCTACGLLGRCEPQLIVEADGSVYPCDFYALDRFRLGNLSAQTLESVLGSPLMAAFSARKEAPKSLCGECSFRDICNGGCPRMRNEVFYRGGDSRCGHREFLDACIRSLGEIAAGLMQRP